jgi:hypothetical protein
MLVAHIKFDVSARRAWSVPTVLHRCVSVNLSHLVLLINLPVISTVSNFGVTYKTPFITHYRHQHAPCRIQRQKRINSHQNR